MKSHILAVLGASAVLAQRQNGTSICDHYSQLLLGASNATTQYTLLTLLVNTAVIGNYSNASHAAVPGILNPNATFNSTPVNLVQYFDGKLDSNNRGGKTGVAINFLDGGGAAPLMMNKPSDGTTSNQYTLLMHLYSYFGTLLGCSNIGGNEFPAYTGEMSMYEVHKFMALDAYEVSYFIEQVGLSAASFGVTPSDVNVVAIALTHYFGYKCAKPEAVLPKSKKELQAICIADCPTATAASCGKYGAVIEPKAAAMTSSSNGSSNASSTASSGSGPGSSSTAMSMSSHLGASLLGVFVLVGGMVCLLG